MRSRTVALIAVAQVVLLVAYVPMAWFLYFQLWAHLPPEVFDSLPVRLIACGGPALVAVAPILYGGLRAKGWAGLAGIFVAAYVATTALAWQLVAAMLGEILTPPDAFAPLVLPLILGVGMVRAPELAAIAVIGGLGAAVVAVRGLIRWKGAKTAAAAVPAVFLLAGWLSSEAAFALWMPAAATKQFGGDYCLTYVGSVARTLRYGLAPSPYRHAELNHQGASYHWSFKARAYVPEDHWGNGGYVASRTCKPGQHRSPEAWRL